MEAAGSEIDLVVLHQFEIEEHWGVQEQRTNRTDGVFGDVVHFARSSQMKRGGVRFFVRPPLMPTNDGA